MLIMPRVAIGVVFTALCLSLARAQQAQLPPEQEAMMKTIGELSGKALDWQTQAIAAQREVATQKARIAELEKQLADGKPKQP